MYGSLSYVSCHMHRSLFISIEKRPIKETYAGKKLYKNRTQLHQLHKLHQRFTYHTRIHVFVEFFSLRICICMYMYVYTCIPAHMCMYIYVCICVYVYLYRMMCIIDSHMTHASKHHLQCNSHNATHTIHNSSNTTHSLRLTKRN